ncbi:M56 family metallopeptidase [Candidatus Allofournierella merdipullorum]|uniref:M56 family metallopeptidase n=1 Tax=Candidatus Allofournierella merdipullorum TaxID=2838595 RepID=UPI00374FC537
MRTLFLDYFAQSLVLGLAILALLAAAPLLQKRYSGRWFCRAWLALAVLLVLPLRAVLPENAPATITLTPPAALLAAEEPSEAPAPLTAVPGPDTEHLTAPGAPSGQITVPDQNIGQAVVSPETDHPAPEASEGEATVSPSPLAALAPLDWLALLWLAGVAAVAGWQWFGYFVWRRMALRRALPANESWQTALSEALARQPLAKRPRLLASPDVTGAMAAGLFRPVLLVPEGTQPGPDGAYLLAHELTHLHRNDLARKALFSLVLALHWYNPAAWLLAKRAGRDIETACDEAVLAALGTEHRAAYCDALLHAVNRRRAPALTTCFSLTKKDVKARFARLWDTTPKRRGATALAVFCLTATLAGALVACNAVPAKEHSEPVASAPPASTEPVSELATSTDVWPSVYYAHNGAFQSSGVDDPGLLPSEKLPVDLASVDRHRWAGYASPDKMYFGLAVAAADAEHPGQLALWVSNDGGENWTTTALDCSAWLERMGEEEHWDERKQSVFNKSIAWAIPKHYQFVSPEVGFLAFYGRFEYGPADARVTATSDAFVLLRTLDGGENWQEMYYGNGRDIGNGTPFNISTSTPFAFLNENVGFLCAHGEGYSENGKFNLLRTIDGGQTWQQLDLGEVSATLPGAPWKRSHVCGALGCSTSHLPQSDLITGAEPGFAAFSAWGDKGGTIGDTVILYTRDYGASWQWMYRYDEETRAQYTASLIESYASKDEVWPVSYCNCVAVEKWPDGFEGTGAVKAGYTSPDGMYAGMVPVYYERNDPTSLTLWNTSDGGETWTTTTIDCSAWLKEMTEANDWASLEADGVGNGSARVMPSAYQFVNPSTGFLAYYGGWEYGPTHNRHTVYSPGFVLLRTTDGGETWQEMYSGDCSDFVGGTGEGISLSTSQPFLFLNEKVGFLCAHGGGYGTNGKFNLLRTVDGGQTWQLLDLSEVASTLPGAPWDMCHICGTLGLGGTKYEPDLFSDAQPGFAAFTGWGDSGERLQFYTRDYGESWQWTTRTPADITSQEGNEP